MYLTIKSSDTLIHKSLNIDGNWSIELFKGTTTINDVLFFKINQRDKMNIYGWGFFTASGFVYDDANISGQLCYHGDKSFSKQILNLQNLTDISLTFFDKDGNSVSVTNWILILKRV